MAEIIRMPRLSDTMEEGNIVGWLKNVGDKVSPGDVLAEVETDKATMELESYQSGTLLYIGTKKGTVPVNGILAVIGNEGEDFQALLDAAQGKTAAAPAETIVAAPAAAEPALATNSNADGRVKASPLAKSIAAEVGLDISKIQGTGEQGRIIKRDVEVFVTHKPAAAAPAPPPPVVVAPLPPPVAAPAPASSNGNNAPKTDVFGSDNYEDEPLSQMRKIIARRLSESKFSAPHFYLKAIINMDKAIEIRQRINEVAAPVKISFNDMIVKACAAALRKHQAINTSWMGDKLRHNHSINIGVAVAITDGLLVPVVRHADMKSLSQINNEVKMLAAKAKERKLSPEEMSGNTFTISNLGMFDIEEFTAIINPPDSCILAVGSIQKVPIVKNDEIVVGNMMKVILSSDHRVVDGSIGAEFLQTLKAILEDPIRLMV